MPENDVWIHPKTAAKLGIKNGDKIELSNKLGKALVTEGIREDTTFAYFGFGHVSQGLKRAHKRGVNAFGLLPHRTAPVVGMNVHTCGVKIKKA